MNYTLSIYLEEKNISCLLAIEDILSATGQVGYDRDLSDTFDRLINDLLKQSVAAPAEIKTLLITCDFLDLFEVGQISRDKIGYIRYLPKITRDHHPLEHSSLQELVITGTVDSLGGLEDILKKMSTQRLSALAINPSYFTWRHLTREVLEPLVSKHLGPLPFLIGSALNKIGYSARENLLLINTLLLPGVNHFYNKLHQAMKKVGIEAKILTLRGNGMLMTESKARQFPIYTVKAPMAGCFLIDSPFSGHVIKVFQQDKQLIFGLTEQGLPHAPSAPIHYRQASFQIPYPFTRRVILPNHRSSDSLGKAIKEILTSLNMTNESIPVVIDLPDSEIKSILFRICQRLYLPVISCNPHTKTGALAAPVCIEHEYCLSDYRDANRLKIQAALWDKIDQELISEQLQPLGEWSRFWDERFIRYLPEQTTLVHLGVYGRYR
ncbi:methylhydantoinase [Desulfotomaculum sp. 1211_IL3151]|uniref:methylhydantoinase n=1 Tax=Desulfotomaculum sp. 1211_IL3151 TaxID=3084055 RepID=UPI002FD9080B